MVSSHRVPLSYVPRPEYGHVLKHSRGPAARDYPSELGTQSWDFPMSLGPHLASPKSERCVTQIREASEILLNILYLSCLSYSRRGLPVGAFWLDGRRDRPMIIDCGARGEEGPGDIPRRAGMDSRPQAGKSEPRNEPVPTPGEPACRRTFFPGSPASIRERWSIPEPFLWNPRRAGIIRRHVRQHRPARDDGHHGHRSARLRPQKAPRDRAVHRQGPPRVQEVHRRRSRTSSRNRSGPTTSRTSRTTSRKAWARTSSRTSRTTSRRV